MSATTPSLTRIVAATDLSEPARAAARRAAKLAREAGATVTLLHVVPAGALDDLRDWLGTPLTERVNDLAARSLESLATELRKERQVSLEVRLEVGAVATKLVAVADELRAELLVVGARGAGILRRLYLGTTAERLLRQTTRPVLLVRQPVDGPYRRVLLALGSSRHNDRLLEQARLVAPDARWVLCNAFQVPFEKELRVASVDEDTISYYREQARANARSRLERLAEAAGLSQDRYELRVVEGEASLRLIEQQEALGCDLTVIGKHEQNALEELLLGSVTTHVVAESTTDVLVVPRLSF
jgi:nucleotide-binding universal stress UspA family protein